jgi:hypothetical protein
VSEVTIEGREYILSLDTIDPFISPQYKVAFCDELAARYRPIILDPQGYGRVPVPPDFMAYRIVFDERHQRLCIIYEIYWRRQDCTWRELNKDHNHDYEQIQIHFDITSGEMTRVVLASEGPPIYGGHGVEIYSSRNNVWSGEMRTHTASVNSYPWGRHLYKIWVVEQPLKGLLFRRRRPVVRITTCYHVYTGIVQDRLPPDFPVTALDVLFPHELEIPLCRLTRQILWKWYYQHFENRFGHDLSHPFDPPHIMYVPSPRNIKPRLLYTFLGILTAVRRVITAR